MTTRPTDPWDDSPIDAQLANPGVTRTKPPASPEDPVDPAMPTVFTDMIQNRAAVLAILFLATGALGIPLLWINRKFSSIERVFWAVVVTVYTAALIAGLFAILMWSYRRIQGY